MVDCCAFGCSVCPLHSNNERLGLAFINSVNAFSANPTLRLFDIQTNQTYHEWSVRVTRHERLRTESIRVTAATLWPATCDKYAVSFKRKDDNKAYKGVMDMPGVDESVATIRDKGYTYLKSKTDYVIVGLTYDNATKPYRLGRYLYDNRWY